MTYGSAGGHLAFLGLHRGFEGDPTEFIRRAGAGSRGAVNTCQAAPDNPAARRRFPRLWQNGAEQPWERRLPAASRGATASAWQPCGITSPLGSDCFRKQAVLGGFTVKSQWLKLLGGVGL